MLKMWRDLLKTQIIMLAINTYLLALQT